MTIDDELLVELKRLAYETARPFKQVVNETLRSGLAEPAKAHPYLLEPADMGHPRIDLTKALRLAADLEDEEFRYKLQRSR